MLTSFEMNFTNVYLGFPGIQIIENIKAPRGISLNDRDLGGLKGMNFNRGGGEV